jgi:hypothetical protein
MPAAPSSPTVPVIGHLAGFAGEAGPGLLALLAKIEDPRHWRGVRHRLVVILALAVCAVLAGARSFTAIAEWATDADEETLARLGVMGKVPAESTIRRVLQRLDVDAFDKLAGAWAAQRTAPVAGRRRVVAVDGKTLRGSGRGGQDARTCSLRSITRTARCSARSKWARRPMKSPGSACGWTRWTSETL